MDFILFFINVSDLASSMRILFPCKIFFSLQFALDIIIISVKY